MHLRQQASATGMAAEHDIERERAVALVEEPLATGLARKRALQFPRVEVVDGVTQALLSSFQAFDQQAGVGVWVAKSDPFGDGKFRILASGGQGSPPEVKRFDALTPSKKKSKISCVLSRPIGSTRLVSMTPRYTLIMKFGYSHK